MSTGKLLATLAAVLMLFAGLGWAFFNIILPFFMGSSAGG